MNELADVTIKAICLGCFEEKYSFSLDGIPDREPFTIGLSQDNEEMNTLIHAALEKRGNKKIGIGDVVTFDAVYLSRTDEGYEFALAGIPNKTTFTINLSKTDEGYNQRIYDALEKLCSAE